VGDALIGCIGCGAEVGECGVPNFGVVADFANILSVLLRLFCTLSSWASGEGKVRAGEEE